MSSESRRLRAIGWLSRQTKLDLDKKMQDLNEAISVRDQRSAEHEKAVQVVDVALTGLKDRVRRGQTLNLALYQSDSSHIEHCMRVASTAQADVGRAETEVSDRRDSVSSSRLRLQKLEDRGDQERSALASQDLLREQNQHDELWLLRRPGLWESAR